MKLSDVIKTGELLEVKVGEISVNTKFEEMIDEDRFLAFAPTLKGMPIWDSGDELFRFWFYRANGVFQFDAELVNAYTRDGLRYCEFRVISELVKNQRREFYRLPIVLDMAVSLTMLSDAGEIRDGERIRAKTVDLSEKSLKFSAFVIFPEETRLFVDIQMTDMKVLTLKASVYKSIKPLRPTDPFETVVIFDDLSKYHRAYISRYIMQKQIEARRKQSRRI